MNYLESIKAGIFGTVVGDALGVPVEFTGRAARKADPVKDMREYGTHNQPKGTWSDDSSMMLATLDSIIINGGIRYDDIMGKAVNLGDDTDTVGAVTGGLARLAYGYDDIPADWIDVIIKKEWIEKMCDDFAHVMS